MTKEQFEYSYNRFKKLTRSKPSKMEYKQFIKTVTVTEQTSDIAFYTDELIKLYNKLMAG